MRKQTNDVYAPSICTSHKKVFARNEYLPMKLEITSSLIFSRLGTRSARLGRARLFGLGKNNMWTETGVFVLYARSKITPFFLTKHPSRQNQSF